MEATSSKADPPALHESLEVVRHPALIRRISPPEGTDVRAVQGKDDPRPVVVGTVVVR